MTSNDTISRFNSELPYNEAVSVRFRDTDQQGHLYFANYLVYADEVAMGFLESLGFHAMDFDRAPCFIFTVNINCDYMADIRADEQVRVFVGYKELGRSSAVLAYESYNEATGVQLSKGTITQVFVSKASRRATRIPTGLRQAICAKQPELV